MSPIGPGALALEHAGDLVRLAGDRGSTWPTGAAAREQLLRDGRADHRDLGAAVAGVLVEHRALRRVPVADLEPHRASCRRSLRVPVLLLGGDLAARVASSGATHLHRRDLAVLERRQVVPRQRHPRAHRRRPRRRCARAVHHLDARSCRGSGTPRAPTPARPGRRRPSRSPRRCRTRCRASSASSAPCCATARGTRA